MANVSSQKLFHLSLLFFVLHLVITPMDGQVLRFEQLNRKDFSPQDFSDWGRVTATFSPTSTVEYLNLFANGRWVVNNLSLGNIITAGTEQTVSTTFDLGNANGTPVSSLIYGFSITSAQLVTPPPLATFQGAVHSIDYEIDGDSGGATILLAPPPSSNGSGGGHLLASATLPGIDGFVNQEQKSNECVPGAISNSLRYLKSRSQLPSSYPSDIDSQKKIVKWTASGAAPEWWNLKATGLPGIDTTTTQDPLQIIDAIKSGKDIELREKGHAAFVVGLRVFDNGMDIDVFDDNQLGDGVDPMRTIHVNSSGDTSDGMKFDRFVVETPVPEPATYSIFAVVVIGSAAFARRRRQANGDRIMRFNDS